MSANIDTKKTLKSFLSGLCHSSATASALSTAKATLKRFRSIKHFGSEQTFAEADAALAKLADVRKSVRDDAKTRRDPLNAAAKAIKAQADDFDAEVATEVDRLAERVHAYAVENHLQTCVRPQTTIRYVVTDVGVLPTHDPDGNPLFKVDQVAVNRALKAGHKLPGVKVEEDVKLTIVAR